MSGWQRRLKNNVRWLLAWCWSKVYEGHGRHTDPSPVRCGRCGWAGPCRWLRHEYRFDGIDDVEPVDYCPGCGTEV